MSKERGTGDRVTASLLTLVPCLLVPLLLSGCAKHKKKHGEGKGKERKDELPVKSVGVGAGYTTVYQSADPKSPTSFTLGWKNGNFDATSGTVDKGHLEEPHGQIFQNGKPTSTYRADTGDAVSAIKRLNMRDHVQLQSLDKTQTLTADRGEYRGDVKLVRAIGNVVAKTPSGTLSGAPELWATPDLKLIGTPDMVAKTLKIPALAALAATAAVGVAQTKPIEGPDYRLENWRSVGTNREEATRQGFTALPQKGKPLVLTLKSKGIVITSVGAVTVLLEPKTKQVLHLTSQGAVYVVQTSGAGTTTMQGDGSVYDAPAGAETGTLDVGGRVTLTSETRRKDAKGGGSTQTTVSKGDKGRALLFTRPPKEGDALKEAVLTGNVTIDSRGSTDGTFRGTGERLVYTPRDEMADVDLTGAVVLTTTNTTKDDAGKPATQTTVSRGRSAHAVIDPKAGAEADPLRNATLTGGTVSIDVTGVDGQTFKGTGDKVVYNATGGGNGRAVMTGDLKFSGDAPDYLSDVAGADTAVLTIGRKGWQTVNLENSSGTDTTTTITTKHPPAPRGTATSPGGKKKKKGGKG